MAATRIESVEPAPTPSQETAERFYVRIRETLDEYRHECEEQLEREGNVDLTWRSIAARIRHWWHRAAA